MVASNKIHHPLVPLRSGMYRIIPPNQLVVSGVGRDSWADDLPQAAEHS
jgi:hypothetical protein